MKSKITAGKLRVSLNISPAFTESCNQGGINIATALQHFINAVAIHTHLDAKSTSTASLASQLLTACDRSKRNRRLSDNRNTLAYLTRLLNIKKSDQPLHTRQALHNQLINEWYQHLFL